MRLVARTVLLALAVSFAVATAAVVDAQLKPKHRKLIDYVDTRIGTSGRMWGIGQINPGPQVPFGAMRVGPDTSLGTEPLRDNWEYGGYWYKTQYIECFSHTHMVGSGVNDYQNFGIMITRSIGNEIVNFAGYRSKYSHQFEVAKPGYYAALLETPNVYAELAAAGKWSAIERYTCTGDGVRDCFLLFDFCHVAPREDKPFDMNFGCSQAGISRIQRFDDGAGDWTVEGWVTNSGSMSSRGSATGVNIYFQAKINCILNSTQQPVNLTAHMWANKTMQEQLQWPFVTFSKSLGLFFTAPIIAPMNDSLVYVIRTSISYVSQANAGINLKNEQFQSPGWMTFEQAVTATQYLWENTLQRIVINQQQNANVSALTTFYSSMYRAHMGPTTFSETNGLYLGMDNDVHRVKPNQMFMTDLSLWDIYRTQAPLLVFTAPDVHRAITQSLTLMHNQLGFLPRWPLANIETGSMVGSHGAIIMAESIVKNIGGLNAEAIYDVVFQAVQNQSQMLDQYGFIPLEVSKQGTGLTLEYAVDAAAAGMLALYLNHTNVAANFFNYSLAYKNVWEGWSQFMCPRYSNGLFSCPVPTWNPYPLEQHYIEGNAQQFRWYVPHHGEGLVNLFQSKGYFAQQLHDFFLLSNAWAFNTTLPNNYFWAGNEPDLLTVVQFNFAGNEFAHLTQSWFAAELEKYYQPIPQGLPGNDDYGTLSSWCIFGHLGFYPIASTTKYALFTPMFDNITFTVTAEAAMFSPWRDTFGHCARCPILNIIAYNRPAATLPVYVSKVALNGQLLTEPFFKHEDLLGGAKGTVSTLEFWLTGEPTVFNSLPPSQGGPKPWMPAPLDVANAAADASKVDQMREIESKISAFLKQQQ